MTSGTTTVQISREASALLDSAARSSKLAKSYLATTAVRLLFDPELNPNLVKALEALSGRQAEKDFMKIVLDTRTSVEG